MPGRAARAHRAEGRTTLSAASLPRHHRPFMSARPARKTIAGIIHARTIPGSEAPARASLRPIPTVAVAREVPAATSPDSRPDRARTIWTGIRKAAVRKSEE